MFKLNQTTRLNIIANIACNGIEKAIKSIMKCYNKSYEDAKEICFYCIRNN